MSQANVERIREGYETWKATRELDFTLIHPEVEWVFIDPEGGSRQSTVMTDSATGFATSTKAGMTCGGSPTASSMPGMRWLP